MQARGVFQRGPERVEARGQVGQRVHQHRDVGGLEFTRHAPGFAAAHDHRLHAVPRRELQRLADVGCAVHVEDHAATGQVSGQRRAAGARQQAVAAAGAGFGHGLFQQHPLAGAAAAGQFGGAAAQVHEQAAAARQRRVVAAVQQRGAALAGHEAAARQAARRQHGEGQALHARHRDGGRAGIERHVHVELGAPGAALVRRHHRAQREVGVHGGGLARHFLDAQAGEAREQARRQRPALGVHHGDPRGRSEVGAHRAHHAALHQHVVGLERALRAGGVHGGIAHQQVLRGNGQGEGEGQHDQKAVHGATSWPSMKSETGRLDGSSRSCSSAPST